MALDVVPIDSAAGSKDLPMVFDITMGLRRGNDVPRAQLDRAIEHRSAEIREILLKFRVPLVEESSRNDRDARQGEQGRRGLE